MQNFAIWLVLRKAYFLRFYFLAGFHLHSNRPHINLTIAIDPKVRNNSRERILFPYQRKFCRILGKFKMLNLRVAK